MPPAADSADDSDDDGDDSDDDPYMARDSDDTSESSGSGEHSPVDERERDVAVDSDEESRHLHVARLQSLETLGGASASAPTPGGVASSEVKKKRTRGRARGDDGSKRLKWGPNLPKATMKGGK